MFSSCVEEEEEEEDDDDDDKKKKTAAVISWAQGTQSMFRLHYLFFSYWQRFRMIS